MKVTKAFSASEDGINITHYSEGEYEELPPVALAHATNIGALEEAKDPEADTKASKNTKSTQAKK